MLSQAFHFPAGRPLQQEPEARLGLAATAASPDADGRVSLTVTSRRLAYGVRIHAPGFVPSDDAFSVEPGGSRRIRLQPDAAGSDVRRRRPDRDQPPRPGADPRGGAGMTGTVPEARPVVLAIEPDPVFGTFHDTADVAADVTAVLICPPFGWDEITSYRSRRAWAERLAADGHPTLRIDLPGAGDSAGSPTDSDRLTAWSRAIAGSAAWLAERPGVNRVVAIGLGLGGLLTAVAIADGAPIADLVVWAAPESGRSWLREQRAFASLQTSRVEPDSETTGPAADDGLEVGGFSLTAETIAALKPLVLPELLAGRIGRALLLDRDGLASSPRVADSLAKGGAVVSQASGAGWTQMVFHPEEYRAPVEVFDTVAAWLAQPSPAGHVVPKVEAPSAGDALETCEGESASARRASGSSSRSARCSGSERSRSSPPGAISSPSSSTPERSGASGRTGSGSRRRDAGPLAACRRSGWTSRASATPTATPGSIATSATSTRPPSARRWRRSSTTSRAAASAPGSS